jgi:hypothetical protein
MLLELVTEHWHTWSERGALPEDAGRLLAGRRGDRIGLRIPIELSDEIFAQAGDNSAASIVAELIARHLPERIARFRSPTAPQQEELALSS